MRDLNLLIFIMQLIQNCGSARLRAMFRFAIILISIVWASLLLISWSGATPVIEENQNQQATVSDHS